MTSETSSASDTLQEVRALWSRLSRQHVSFGQGCACGFGGLVLAMSDLEQDIIEFVVNDATQAGRQDVVAELQPSAGGKPPRISDLLKRFEQAGGAHPSTAEFVVERVRRTLQSIETSHRGGGFVCSAL